MAGRSKTSAGVPTCSTRPWRITATRSLSAEGLLPVVGDEQEGDPQGALEVLELDLDLLAELRVESGQRLVEEQHLRLQDQGPGQGHPLALAAAELVGEPPLQPRQPDQRERLPHPGGDRAARGRSRL